MAGLTTLDDTLPALPVLSGAGTASANLAAVPTAITGSSSSVSSLNAAATGNILSNVSGFVSGFSAGRVVAIVLGIVFIGGAILLFLGDDIAGATKVASRVVA